VSRVVVIVRPVVSPIPSGATASHMRVRRMRIRLAARWLRLGKVAA
jgi:hypothetical protein